MICAERRATCPVSWISTFRLPVIPSVIYTLVSVFVKADESFNSGGAE
jgi:hypothetical protein